VSSRSDYFCIHIGMTWSSNNLFPYSAFKLDRPKQLRGKQKYLKNCHPAASSGAKLWMMQAVITSPEILLCKDSDELFAVHWEMLVIDEAHNRLKNKSSKFSQFVRDERFLFRHCLLLTGTPVQNNIDL
jgi:SNF2 family DNA or RNA helicase